MSDDQHLSDEQVLASAARFLIDGHEEDAANVLLSCSLEMAWKDHGVWGEWEITLTGPRAAYEIITTHGSSEGESIERAIRAVLPPDSRDIRLSARAELVQLDAGWRDELLEIARGRHVHNQGVEIKGIPVITWANLRFRYQAEIRIAKVLDEKGVLFFPNCLCRLNGPNSRANREPDFLVCHRGKWGVLEIDGEPFHPPSRTVQDHERDRLFRNSGIRLIEHFDATQCYEAPHKVVDSFLMLLADL